MTLTLNKEFLHPVFLLFPTGDILLVIFISVDFLYTVAKVIKICFKICQIPIFSQFDFFFISAYINSHVLLMCVIYLVFFIISNRTKLVQYTSMLVSEI